MNLTICRAAALAAAVAFVPAVFAATPIEEAQGLITAGDYDGALKRIDKYLSSSPQDAEARFTRGLVLVKLNRNPEAIKVFADLTRDYPQLPEPYNNLAVLYAQQGDYEKARDALEAALATHPSYATAHENLGDIYAALAGAAYNRALALDQANQSVRYKLSLLNQLGAQPTGGAAATVAPKPVVSSQAPAVPVATALPSAAPADAGTPPAADSPAAEAALAAVETWAKAWSARNVDEYLGAYSADFQPEAGLSHADWEAQRRTRVAKAHRIAVKVLKPQASVVDEKTVRVSFTQDYSSDAFSDRTAKTLELRDEGGSWKIVRESLR